MTLPSISELLRLDCATLWWHVRIGADVVAWYEPSGVVMDPVPGTGLAAAEPEQASLFPPSSEVEKQEPRG